MMMMMMLITREYEGGHWNFQPGISRFWKVEGIKNLDYPRNLEFWMRNSELGNPYWLSVGLV
jgi:hypothetical protein